MKGSSSAAKYFTKVRTKMFPNQTYKSYGNWKKFLYSRLSYKYLQINRFF